MSVCPNGDDQSIVRKLQIVMQRMNPLNKTPPKGAKVLTWDVTDLNSGGIQVGDYCTKYGMTFQWTEKHMRGYEMEKLRYIGDDLCEDCLEELNIKPQDDALDMLLKTDLSKNPNSAELMRQLTTAPKWFDAESARRGQEFYRKNAGFMGKMLLHMALVGGYGSAKINKVLSSTRYLIGELDDTFRRLMETALCVTEFMEDGGLDPITGRGWQCAVRVRFLHGKVRRRLRKSDKWDTEQWGIPINQEDLVATLMAFSVAMIHASRLITGTSDQEAKDFMMIWRYVGYLLGIHDEFNPATEEQGTAFMESVLFHQIQPDESSRALAGHTLRSVEHRTPEGWELSRHEALSRLFMGPTYADEMDRPEMSITDIPFHMTHIVGDAIYTRIIINIPILGRMITEANWRMTTRGLREVLAGKTLSIYSQSMDVNDDNVGDYKSSGTKKNKKAITSFGDLKYEQWFEPIAYHSVKIYLAMSLLLALAGYKKLRERRLRA